MVPVAVVLVEPLGEADASAVEPVELNAVAPSASLGISIVSPA